MATLYSEVGPVTAAVEVSGRWDEGSAGELLRGRAGLPGVHGLNGANGANGAHQTDGFSRGAEVSDEGLMGGVQNGEAGALEALYRRHSGVLRVLIQRMLRNEAESEDLLQEVYLEVWRHAGNYSPQKGRPLGWLVTLTRRRAIDRLRKRQSDARGEERLQKEAERVSVEGNGQGVSAEVELAELRRFLGERLAQLPGPQRQAVELAYYRGLSQREIAVRTRTPLGTVKTRLELGLKKLGDGLREIRSEF
jgi:RNA polymerase sigma-70 factor (ECF subfamily)